MIQTYFRRMPTVISVCLLLFSFATAQDGWDRLSSLKGGTSVSVERANGARLRGKFVLATPDALTIRSGGRQSEIAKTEVNMVYLTRRSSRLKRGLVGALAGAGAGVLIGVVAVVAGKAGPLVPAGGLLIGLPAGAAIGAATGGGTRNAEIIYRR